MCGISVIIDAPNQPIRADEIQAMTDAVAHRGPDGEGFWTKKNIAFGHRRLAILDLEPARGQQPMKYLNDRYVIIHNGEIYNYLEIRQLLISKNYNFSTQTDTEVIAAAYDCWGEACLAHFNGMWAFVIFDNQKNTVFAARDRFGVKPLYYYQKNTKFYLASEIKQFTTTSGWQPILNETIALDFLQHGLKNHSNDTFFEEVKTLPAAHFLIYNIDNQQFKIKKYYDLSEKSAEKSTKNFESAKEKFTHLLSDAVRLRLRSDVKIGTALSGGLDSSAVTALATGLLGVPTATVSACFPNQENDETLYIHSVTAFLETTNYPAFPCWEEMKKEMQNLIWQQDEPIGSASVFAQSEVFRMAKKQGLTVMLGGQGADEILGGYDAFLRPYFKNMFQKNLLRAIFSVANYARLHRLNWSQLVGYQKNTIAFFRKESAKIF